MSEHKKRISDKELKSHNSVLLSHRDQLLSHFISNFDKFGAAAFDQFDAVTDIILSKDQDAIRRMDETQMRAVVMLAELGTMLVTEAMADRTLALREERRGAL